MKRWDEIEKYMKTTYNDLKNSCHTNLEVSLKRSVRWEKIDNKQDLFALCDLIVETCRAGGSIDQIDNDVAGFKLRKKLLNFQQHTDGAEFVKRLNEQYNDIEANLGACPFVTNFMESILSTNGLTLVDYFVRKEEHAKTIKACKESYKDHYMAKLSVTNCNSKKLHDDLATNKMFGKDLYPVSTAEFSNMILKYDALDLEQS